ncbi:uncharacterized protein LOC131620238 [Vicia villosa]|uniref:uncharacterized protein LOC131620238 n=1 Tax=Vicia villosa TaxID=3911 RepID=UPI00273C4774|nr:uncharacterized protein LOC131620238 [Vicia villosa]
MLMNQRGNFSWVMKKILNQREDFNRIMIGVQGDSFKSKMLYEKLKCGEPLMPWFKLLWNNLERPRAQFILWLACHDRLATRERLHRFNLIASRVCVFCSDIETTKHLFFECPVTNEIWCKVLDWLQVKHKPKNWSEEKDWLIKNCKGKGWRSTSLKCAVTETIYYTWMLRNDMVFGKDNNRQKIVKDIIDTLVYRLWENRKVRKHLALLMV